MNGSAEMTPRPHARRRNIGACVVQATAACVVQATAACVVHLMARPAGYARDMHTQRLPLGAWGQLQ